MKKLALAAALLLALPALAGSPPNFAYVYGTTPTTGGVAAFEQAVASLFLGVNTTITSGAITGSGTPQTVTVSSATNIGVGSALWVNWGASDQEAVSITSVSGSNITGIFANSHAAAATIGVGLNYQTGITNPWSKPTFQTGFVAVYLSRALTASGDASYIPLLFGTGSGANTVGFAVADDLDNSGTNSSPRDVVNWNGTNITPGTVTLQDASFSWWMNLCEFGVVGVVDVAGSYSAFTAGQLRTAMPTSQRGVGIANAVIASAATSVTLTTDISSRIAVGESILIVNQSHSSASTNWASAPALMTVQTVTGNGTTSTITFTGGTPRAFDSGALVGAIPVSATFGGGLSSLDSSSYYATRDLSGIYTAYNSSNQTLSGDNAVVTSSMGTYEAPTQAPQAMYAGELDLPLYSTLSTKTGVAGFPYGFQEFVQGSASQQDAFYDGSGPFVWKCFLTSARAIGLGPLLNAQNTQTQPTNWVP